jgi:DNA-directed RNA polymerase subunit E'
MFYELEVRSHTRVPPAEFGNPTDEAILRSLNSEFENYVSKELGVIIGVTDVLEVGEGIIIPGDGAAYYNTLFKIVTFKPELNETVLGKVTEISDFGAFITIGPIDGMMHISQTMNDYVSFSKSNILTGKESKKILKVGEICRTKIIAVSHKEMSNPKIGLTMRQHRLGALKWIKDEIAKDKKSKTVKETTKTKK